MSSNYLLEESLFIREVGGPKPESANGEAESPGTGVFSRYLLEESLFIREVGGPKPESANGEAESPGTGECPPASRGYVMLHPGPGRKRVGSEHR